MKSARDNSKVAIIGAGVIGLTSAVCLLEAGWRVTILARERTPNTTSDVAPALWMPFRAFPVDRVLAWARASHAEFSRLAQTPETGVVMVPLFQYFDQPAPPPWWCDGFIPFTTLERAELGKRFQAGYKIEIPLIDSSVYMPYLLDRFAKLGGEIQEATLRSLADVPEEFSLIVNCSGVGARELVRDEKVFPIRGEAVWVRKPDGIGTAIVEVADGPAPTYVVPRRDHVLLGSVVQENDWSREPRADIAADVIQRCAAIQPLLKDFNLLAHKVGLRPGRAEVRLELEQPTNGRAVIHNYGHGGSGFTTSWACADEVVQLARS
ncbi:MAG: FAD-dependent oxidoreductase [Verrucomicrobia bacterium]|nr:FAD-dependent oxidoreductase [Verrucomicrobiota bacterium]